MLTEQIPFYAVRHSVKPGLTGWAQVRYSYGATVEQSVKKLEYDLYYVKNHTLVLDLSSCSRPSAWSCSARARASGGGRARASALPRLRPLRARPGDIRHFVTLRCPLGVAAAPTVNAPSLDADDVTASIAVASSWSYGLALPSVYVAFAAAPRARLDAQPRAAVLSRGGGRRDRRCGRARAWLASNAPTALTFAAGQRRRRAALRGVVRVPRDAAARPEAELATRSPARWPMVIGGCGAAGQRRCCPKGCRSPPRSASPTARRARAAARARGLRAGARRAALPPRASAGALGDQAAVPWAGGDVRLRPLPLRGRAAVRPDRRGHLDRARRRERAGHSVPRRRDGAQHRLDDRDAPVARRGVPLDGARRLGRLPAGASPASGYFVRYFGGDWGRALQIELLFAGAAVRRAGRVVGALPLAAQGLRQQALLLLSLRLPRGVAALHAHAVADSVALSERRRARRSRRSPTWSRARRARSGCADERRALRAGGALEHAAGRRGRSRATASLAAVPAADRLGRQPRRVRGRTRRDIRISCCPRWLPRCRTPGSSCRWSPARS